MTASFFLVQPRRRILPVEFVIIVFLVLKNVIENLDSIPIAMTRYIINHPNHPPTCHRSAGSNSIRIPKSLSS